MSSSVGGESESELARSAEELPITSSATDSAAVPAVSRQSDEPDMEERNREATGTSHRPPMKFI